MNLVVFSGFRLDRRQEPWLVRLFSRLIREWQRLCEL